MLILTLSCTKSVIDNSLDLQPKVLERRTLPYFTATTTNTVRGGEPIKLVRKDTKPEEKSRPCQEYVVGTALSKSSVRRLQNNSLPWIWSRAIRAIKFQVLTQHDLLTK